MSVQLYSHLHLCFLSLLPASIHSSIIPAVLPPSLILFHFLPSPAIHYRSLWHLPGSSLSSSIPLGGRYSDKEQHGGSCVSLYVLIRSRLIIHNGSDHHSQFLPSVLGWQYRDIKASALCLLIKILQDNNAFHSHVSLLQLYLHCT